MRNGDRPADCACLSLLLLLYYVEIVSTAFVEMLFMLLILRRTATFAQQTQASFQTIPGLFGQRQTVREPGEMNCPKNEEVFEPQSVCSRLQSSPSVSTM